MHIAHVAVIVRDYDEAIAYYTEKLGFSLIEDTALGPAKRWVLVAPPGSGKTQILLAKAVGSEQAIRVGNQTGSRVFLFLHTDDFWHDYRAMSAKGVRFLEEPRNETYGTVVVFQDLYGNRFDLVQRHEPAR